MRYIQFSTAKIKRLKLAFFYFSVLSFQGVVLIAQPANKYVKDASMPAPNAGALGKYGDIPVSYFTGVPDITVPIYNVQEGSLSLPVSLNYHASGIKVGELASWVGMGFSLNAGGMITRTVQGLPDDKYLIGYYYTGGNFASSPTSQDIYDSVNGLKDSEPDIFSFNVGGYSGKFYLDVTQGVRVIRFAPMQDLKLDIPNPDFSLFILTTPDGTKYTFGNNGLVGQNALEKTNMETGDATSQYISTWYLIKVESFDSKYNISLTYDDEFYPIDNNVSCNYYQAVCNAGQLNTGVGYFDGTSCGTYFNTKIEGKRLKKITTPNLTITFSANTVREDLLNYANLEPPKRMDNVKIESGDITGYQSCQIFNLAYDYYNDPSATGPKAKKLRLTQINEQTCDSLDIKPAHKFTYQGNFIANRFTKRTDHWGYYNGVLSNDNLDVNAPSTIVVQPWNNAINQFGSANRESNETAMQNGILTDIEYPTGGKTHFTYEANRYDGTLPNQEVKKVDRLPSCPFTIPQCCGTTSNPSGLFSFNTLEELNTAKFRIHDITAIPPTGTPSVSCTNINFLLKVEIFRSGEVIPIGTWSQNPGSQNVIQKNLTELMINTNIALVVGQQYYVKFTTTNIYALLTVFSTVNLPSTIIVGGLRIKEIRTNETTTFNPTTDIVKSYQYITGVGATQSSGILFRQPAYGYAGTSGVYTNTSNISGGMNISMVTSQSVVPLTTLQGFHIGYRTVIENVAYNGNISGNGKTIYNYYYENPVPPVFPATPDNFIAYTGQSAGNIVLNAQGGELKNTLLFGKPETPVSSTGTIFKTMKISGLTCALGVSGYGYVFKLYKLKTAPYRIESKYETIDGVQTITNYTFENDLTKHLFPIATSFVNSDGKTITNRTKYTTDYLTDPVYVEMKNRNIIIPIETTEEVKDLSNVTTVTKGGRTVFKLFDKATGQQVATTSNADPYPYQFWQYKKTWDTNGTVQTFPADAGWQAEATINAYDAFNNTTQQPSRGRPQSITYRGWENSPETYEWALNGMITKKTFRNYISLYSYYPQTRLVSSMTNIDGQVTNFTYDKYQRLTLTSSRNGNVQTAYTYKYQDLVNNSGKNWVETKTTFTASIGGTALGFNTTYKTLRQYMDGLGRPIQSVAVANSPLLKDVITVMSYDNVGRLSLTYDPFPSTVNTGAYVSNSNIPPNHPSTLTTYEASPLNRVSQVTPPSWQPTYSFYSSNNGSDALKSDGTFFPVSSLNKSQIQDADGRVSETYTDKKGRKVFTKQYQNGVSGSSYLTYQYDDKDRLTKAIPQRNNTTESNGVTDLDFKYLYDWNDNVIQKKVPDAAFVDMKYNSRNQLIMSQDGNQRLLGRWLGVQYDEHGRPTGSGFVPNSPSFDALGNPSFSTTLTTVVYGTLGTAIGKPISTTNSYGATLQTFLEYDNYGRLFKSYGNNHLYTPTTLTSGSNSEQVTIVYDLADNVLIKTRIHKPNVTTTRTIVEKMEYDNGLRLKQVTHQVDALTPQILSSIDYTIKNQVQTKWMGKPTLGPGSASFLQKVDYSYNTLGWLTGINAPTLNVNDIVNTACNLPFPNTPGANLDENDLFSMDFRYNNPNIAYSPTGAVTAQSGGNISQMIWQVRGREKQVYTFQYDFLSRMTDANYAELNSTGARINNQKYWEKLSYDARGNIQTLQRNGVTNTVTCTFGLIDNLNYFYSDVAGVNPVNRLKKVVDASGDLTRGFKSQSSGSIYTYDDNGNLKSDLNKRITDIQYNHLNLPEKITFNNGGIIEWLYDAGGNKLRKFLTMPTTVTTLSGVIAGNISSLSLIQATGSVATNVTASIKSRVGIELLPNFVSETGSNSTIEPEPGENYDYVGGIEYKNGIFEALYHAEGRVIGISGSLRYEYALKDHLGNTRLMFSDIIVDGIIKQSDNEVTQENHYYPFGLNMEGVWSNNTTIADNKYQFGGKELNSDFGLDWMDFGARQYDAALGRWLSVDPMAELAPNLTPYRYGFNNPMRFTDPNGMYEIGSSASDNVKNMMKDLDEKDKKKKEEEEKKKDNVELFYTNDTKEMITTTHTGSVDKLTTGQIAKIISRTGKIMQRNGVNKNITFKPISVIDAKKHTQGDFGYGFVAFITHSTKSYGLSNIGKDGTISVFNGENFMSWVNYGRIADEISNFPDPLYGAAFSMAHEYLHQLLAFAGKALDNDAYKFSHVNDVPNLNTDGEYIKYPIYPGNSYEVILPSQKAYLQRYFQYLKDQP
jgi:RHS repeat-associated protein